MRDWSAIRERYLRDGLPTRLGGLASNLGRIHSFAAQGGSGDVVRSLMDESAHFIEWTAAEVEVNAAGELVTLQVELARWRQSWPRTWEDPALREEMAAKAGTWSRRVLGISGLLSPIERAAGMLAGQGSLTEALVEEHRKERKRGR
ncbi:MAG TPA: hypothetical protein VFI11_09660 [Anaerolineales bacterium]|nr:hypothetical protein [Anaerolineales bacterium]